ncbi:MAG TPA: hypothetical protein VFS24_08680 [Steroidobacteraceae bacterium]|nr:hypothetical protein [Steroidobacteraceae bacterium]
MSKAPFPITPQLLAIAVAYRNARMIADEVLPRVPVSLQSFKYMSYPLGEGFTVPETRVGRKSRPGTIELSGTEITDSTQDYGLDDAIPFADIDNAAGQPGVPDPEMRATQQLTNLIELDREVRTANLVFNANNYAAANKVTLAGTDQWSDFANSDPVDDILTGLDACIMRPNIGVFGRATFTKLSTHPKICKAVFGNNTDAGIVTRQQIAALLELDDVLVGEGRVNTAKKGQAVSLSRVWGKHAAFLYRDKNADPLGSVQFGFTAQWGSRIAGSIEDKDIGIRGGKRVRVGESVKEVITAGDLGYFIQNAVS